MSYSQTMCIISRRNIITSTAVQQMDRALSCWHNGLSTSG